MAQVGRESSGYEKKDLERGASTVQWMDDIQEEDLTTKFGCWGRKAFWGWGGGGG